MSSYDHTIMKTDEKALVKLYGERTAARNCQYLLPHIKLTSTILDVGCGPGTITSDLAALAPSGQTTGVDNSASIIASAETTFPQSTHQNLTFAVGDIYNLDFPDGSFDIVHAHQVLVHLTEPVAALKELYRVCKPGGLIAVRDSTTATIISLYPDLPSLRSYWARTLEIFPKQGGNIRAGQQLVGWAKEAGLVDVRFSTSLSWYASQLSRVEGEAAEVAVRCGMASREELGVWREGWVEWEGTDGAELVLEAGEILVVKR